MMTSEQVQALYVSIQTRPRPEDVAELVLDVLGGDLQAEAAQGPCSIASVLSKREHELLRYASRYSYKRLGVDYSSMARDFSRPTSQLPRQGAVAVALFGQDHPPMSASDWLDGARALRYVEVVGAQLGKMVGANDFRTDRLRTKASRRAAGIHKNARWYNKRWRLLKRIEEKVARLAWNQRKYDYTRASKSMLAVRLTPEDVAADANTSCFVAYMAARMSRRSAFTNKSQVRAFDTVAQALMARCEQSATTRWDIVAHVLPDASILVRLTDEQKGRLLGQCWELLGGMADMLETTWKAMPGFDLSKMIVGRGHDSSTWNQVAGGWNMIRSQWMSLLHAMGAEAWLDDACPGKVMRAMAADVARWHLASGGDVHPDTKVWALLPTPWDVLRGKARCGLLDVEAACYAAGVKPETWTGPRGDREAVAFAPTPELVHGVAVASPQLATLLRKAGWFSGRTPKSVPTGIVVERDEHGAAILAHEGQRDSAIAQD